MIQTVAEEEQRGTVDYSVPSTVKIDIREESGNTVLLRQGERTDTMERNEEQREATKLSSVVRDKPSGTEEAVQEVLPFW
jgi:hypothetical protein